MELNRDKLFLKIKRLTGRAIGEFNLIEDGDRILVAVSGGKDSYTLLHLLRSLLGRAPVAFDLIAVNVDSGYPGFRQEVLERYLKEEGFRYLMRKTNCFSIIEEKRTPGSSYCSFCARLRRGVLYTVAAELGCNKIALGHHLDDFIETLLLNQFYNGSLAAMSPKLLADNGKHTVIRPLVFVEEKDIIDFAARSRFPVICCACPMCGLIDQKRKQVKRLLRDLSRDNPLIRHSMISALGNVRPRHLLDRKLRPF